MWLVRLRACKTADSRQMLALCPSLLFLCNVKTSKLLIPITLAKAQKSYQIGYFIFRFLLFYTHEYFACVYVCSLCTCLVLVEVRGGFGVPTVSMLGLEPGSSSTAANTSHSWAHLCGCFPPYGVIKRLDWWRSRRCAKLCLGGRFQRSQDYKGSELKNGSRP